MRRLLLFCFACCWVAAASGQAKKPTLTVVPGDVWCFKNGYTRSIEGMDGTHDVSDYKAAMQYSSDLMNVISKINILMTDRGFPLRDLSQMLRNLERTQALNRATVSRASGSQIAESPLDLIKRQARADILLELDWTVNESGPKRSVTYNLRGLDAYTGKQIAGAQGTGAQSFSAELPVLLEEAVMANMDNFCAQLQNHFDDLFANGREVVVMIQVFNDSETTLETEFNGKELAELIDDWMALNTVSNRYSKSDGSDDYAIYDQVRIPLYRENEMPMDAEYFTRNLMHYLKDELGITSKIASRGLGECVLIIGEK
jgi:hypothetical protein